jgi:hypothetical protein
MTGTAILSLEDVRATHRRVEIRQRLHERFDQQGAVQWSPLDLEAGAGVVPVGGGAFGRLPRQ